MLIWLNGSVGTMGCEDGILRAGDTQVLLDSQRVSDQFRDRGMELIENAQQQAQAIVAEAREQADDMIREAQRSIEEARSQAYEEGVRQAVLEWHDRQAQQTVDASQSLRAMHEKLAQVVTTAVERIVGTESRSGLYQRALRNVRALTRGATTLTLKVSPVDFTQAQASIGELGESPAGLQVEVVVDAGLRPGACIFESDLGVLDASLETQLDGLRLAMERAVRAVVSRDGASGVPPHDEPADSREPGAYPYHDPEGAGQPHEGGAEDDEDEDES